MASSALDEAGTWSGTLRPRLAKALASPWFLAAVLLLAAGLRLWHVLALRSLPLFDRLILDSEFYDAWARRLAAGNWLDTDRPYFFDPLYPYFLAGLYRLLGRDVLLLRLVNAGLDVGTVALVAAIGRRVSGAAVGNVAALVYALYRPALFECLEVEKTALGVFLLTAALALATSRKGWVRFFAGVSLGLAALARGNAILMAPLGIAYFALVGESARERLRSAAAFAAGVLIAVSPAIWRNHRVSGEWILTTAGAGPNLYLGNNPWNPTGAYQTLPWIRPESEHEEEDWRAETRRRTGRDLTAKEMSSYWLAETLDYVRGHPGQTALVSARKVGLLVADSELPDAWSVNFLRRFSLPLRIPLVTMALLFPLAALGAAVSFGSRPARLVTCFAAAYMATLVPFYIFARFRIYYVPALAVLAALGLSWLFQARARKVLLGLAAVALLAAVSLAAGGLAGTSSDTDHSQQFANLAELYAERGDFGLALRLLDVGLAEHRKAALLCRKADLLRRFGDVQGSVRLANECVEVDPGYPDAWYTRGLSYEAAGDGATASRSYAQELEFVPGHAFAAYRLRALLAGRPLPLPR